MQRVDVKISEWDARGKELLDEIGNRYLILHLEIEDPLKTLDAQGSEGR